MILMIKKIITLTIFALCLLINFNNVSAENISSITRYNSGNTYYLLVNYDDGSYITMPFGTPWDRDDMYKNIQYQLEHPNYVPPEYGSSIGLSPEEAEKFNLMSGPTEAVKERSKLVDQQSKEMKNAKLPEEPKKKEHGEFLNPYELLFGLL